jgi:hypothetical protein
MKSVIDHLNELSGENYSSFNFNKLATDYAEAIVRQEKIDEANLNEYYNPSVKASALSIEKAKKAVAEMIDARKRAEDDAIPVVSTFDAFQGVKEASRKNSRDLGLSRLATHLEKKWKVDRTGSLTHKDISVLKDHYSKNYPKSAASEALSGISKKGYTDLPKAELMAIAASIHSQEDFDSQMIANGLTSNSPRNVKSRQFILAAVRKRSQTKEMFDNPKFQKGDMKGQIENIEMANDLEPGAKPVVLKSEMYVSTTDGDSFGYEEFISGKISMSEFFGPALSIKELKSALKKEGYSVSGNDIESIVEELKDQNAGDADNTYNQSWFGPTIEYYLVGEMTTEPYAGGVIFTSIHLGGDVRGNYAQWEAYRVDSFGEQFPTVTARLSVEITTNKGNIWIESEDEEAYDFYVNTDETGVLGENESVDFDQIESELAWGEDGAPDGLWESTSKQARIILAAVRKRSQTKELFDAPEFQKGNMMKRSLKRNLKTRKRNRGLL